MPRTSLVQWAFICPPNHPATDTQSLFIFTPSFFPLPLLFSFYSFSVPQLSKEPPKFGENERMGRRFGVLLCAPNQDYVQKIYGGYFSLFKGMLSEAEEIWDLFRVLEGEFPAMEDVCKYDGFVVSGSRFDAHGNDEWILELCRFLQTLHSMRIKVLGICFGHQVLCRALGGKIGRALTGWDIGLRKITISKKMSTKHFGLEIPSIISVLECHQDQVYKVPLGAEILASSDKTSIEMFSLGNHILGVQGHPEYTSDILLNFIDNLLERSCIQTKLNEEAKLSLANSKPDREIWEKICKLFLKS